MMIHRQVMAPLAQDLFDCLVRIRALSGFTLIGGTALALQIGHRKSLDFDFAQFGGSLDRGAINQVIASLRQEGWQVRLATDPAQISSHRINSGTDLLDYVQDHVVSRHDREHAGKVKLTFLAHGRSPQQRQFYQQADKVEVGDCGFNLLGIAGLKVAKTLVLDDRVRSRDLYDLYFLMKNHGWTMHQLVRSIHDLAVNNDPELFFEKMTGSYPVDKDDEGLDPVSVNMTVPELHAYFSARLDDYQVELSEKDWS